MNAGASDAEIGACSALVLGADSVRDHDVLETSFLAYVVVLYSEISFRNGADRVPDTDIWEIDTGEYYARTVGKRYEQ